MRYFCPCPLAFFKKQLNFFDICAILLCGKLKIRYWNLIMKKQRITYIKNLLFPCVMLSALVGFVTGIIIFLFKIIASYVIRLSGFLYAHVRANPQFFPLLLTGAILLGLIVSFILKRARECRGGGIPTAVASIRGLIPLKWIQGLFVLFFSTLLTFLGGVPLGNEGPSVQMGTAAGKGISKILGKHRSLAWERYVMTGGACAGFATATGAPLTGIMFALEDAHRRFSPTIFMVATMSVLTGSVTQNLLCSLFGVPMEEWGFSRHTILPPKYFWIAILIGGICGVCAILFTKLYQWFRKLSKYTLKKVPFEIKIISIFVIVAILGFFCEDFLGSGEHLIQNILHGQRVWHILVAAFAVRALLMLCANNEGISGGVFIPTLTFGAIIAALLTFLIIMLGVPVAEYYSVFIAIGMSSFLAASSRTPITALLFSAEVLSGVGNSLPVGIGVVLSYILVETVGISSFTDSIIEAKTEREHEGKDAVIISTRMTIMPNSFAVGKEVRDILWPPTCTILSIDKHHSIITPNMGGLNVGDVLHIHYQTYDPEQTMEQFSQILGKQSDDLQTKSHLGDENHIVPLD